MGIPTGLSQGAVVDDDNQTVVDLSRLHEETSFNDLLTADGDDSDTMGTPLHVIRRSDVELLTPVIPSSTQLQSWMDNDQDVQMVGVGPRMVLQWYNPTHLQTSRPQAAATGPAETERAHLQRADAPASHDVYWSQNALFYNNWNNEAGFEDSDNDGTPDGYTYTSGALSNEAVAGGVYEAFGPTDGSVAERGDDLIMPLPEPQTWTLSVNVTQLHSDGDTAIYLAGLDASKTVVVDQEAIAGSTGRLSASITTTGDVYYLRAVVLRVKNASAQTTKAKVEKPALRPGTATAYATR